MKCSYSCALVLSAFALAGALSTGCDGTASGQPLSTLLNPGSSQGRTFSQDAATFEEGGPGMGGPNGRFGPGGPRGDGGPGGFLLVGSPLSARLNLTDAQEDQADEIRHQAHIDVRTIARSARDQIRALLTEEQIAKLDELRANGPRAVGLRPSFPPSAGSDPIGDYLGLSDEQKTQVDDIRSAARDAIQARHDQARDAFRAILTPEQQEKLDEIRDIHP